MAEPEVKSKQLTQYIAAIGACMGGFSLGCVIGWSSPAADFFINKTLSQDTEWPHVTSISCLGALTAQLFIALTLDKLGPKVIMIILSLPFCATWVVMGIAQKFLVLLIGRFVLGFCGGSFCVVAPSYIGEIAEKKIRGSLGIMFQLLLVIGIFFEAALSYGGSAEAVTYPPAVAPLILLVIIIFMPDSPAHLIKRKKEEKAKKAMSFFRGKHFDITQDYKDLETYVQEGEGDFKSNMKKKSSIKGCLMLLVLHVVQQLGGINAIMFYAATIFKSATKDIDSRLCNVIMCIAQLVACIITTFVVDKLGRRVLWMISLITMIVCLTMVGVYFFIRDSDEALGEKIAFFPVLFICLYVLGFCFASGPLPWAMIGEYLPSGVKSIVGPSITAINWLLAYAVTFSFLPVVKAVGTGIVFFAFAVVNALGFVYVLFFLIETKGKSLDQIQTELGK